MKRLIPLILAISLVAAACGDDSSSPDAGGSGGDGSTTTTTTSTTTVAPTTTLDLRTPEGALAAARERWAANGLTTYRLATSEICFCPETNWVNSVVDGEVIGHEAVGDESFFDPGPRSMETLFDEIAQAIAAGFASFDAEYHPETGAVVSFYVDVEAEMADEEHGVQVTSVEPFDPDAPPAAVESSALIDDYGCGYGFAKGSGNQDLGLTIYFTGGFAPGGPDVSAPIELPSDEWQTELTTGRDLFANWCDDVIEFGEPTPIIDETWSFVAGTLTVTSGTPEDCAGGIVTATLVGATVESPTGEQVALDNIALTNTGWGCFAG